MSCAAGHRGRPGIGRGDRGIGQNAALTVASRSEGPVVAMHSPMACPLRVRRAGKLGAQRQGAWARMDDRL